MNDDQLTQEQLMHEVAYDAASGVFTRRRDTTRQRAGEAAGYRRADGYVRFRVLAKEYLAHRLAWLYVYGEMPNGHIDHIDGNPSNNAISNLRVVTNSQNMQNQRRASTRNKAGLLGVSWYGKSKMWRARISINKFHKTIGYFKTPELAHAAYMKAKAVMHPFAPTGVVHG